MMYDASKASKIKEIQKMCMIIKSVNLLCIWLNNYYLSPLSLVLRKIRPWYSILIKNL